VISAFWPDLMLDLDSFKRINDVYGHLAGDQALEYMAKILRKTFRQNDFIARLRRG
jgi:diguanylate cyclase (GGDEF)-like protein